MDEKLLELLSTSRVFNALDEKAKRELLPHFTRVELAQSEILFYQGDPSAYVYLLAHGKLTAELTAISGDTRIVGHLEPGETVGELGALSGEPRSLTVKALKNSILLKLPAQNFIEICHRYPSVMYATVHPLIIRSKGLVQFISSEKSHKHIVLVPANKNISIKQFSEQLIAVMKVFSNTLILSDYDEMFHDKKLDSTILKEKIQQLTQGRKSLRRILYLLSSYDTSLAKYAFKKADKIYIIGDSQTTARLDHHVIDKIQSQRIHLQNDPELILLHPADSIVPKNTKEWLAVSSFTLHHQVRMNFEKDFQRLARFIRGKAVGLVLSGGGTRGWAHLGVIKALLETKMPIDIIGGTSVGALVAAAYALHESYAEAYEKFFNIIVASNHSVSWRSLTWPAVSLFNAKNFTESQLAVFKNQQIEDLWLPYFCISCNLSNSTEEVHKSGLLWEKTRASTSIPGIIPPMLINNELHLDGGLLNNLPVDVMRQLVGNKGKIIAVELNSFAPDKRKFNFPPILTFKTALFAKLGIGENQYKFPRFTDMFLRSLFLGSLHKSKQNSLGANIFISLNLSKFRLLLSNPKQADRLIEIGYRETLKLLHQVKS